MNPFHDISTPYYFLFSYTYYYFAEENKFMAGLAQSVEQVEMCLYVISHLTMMQEYELLRSDMDARVTSSSLVSSPNYQMIP